MDNDPHFVISVSGLKEAVCFDVDGRPGLVYQLLHDRITGILSLFLCLTLSVVNRTKKVLRETQTLRAGCSKAERKKFRPATDSLPGGAGRAEFNQLEMVTTFTYKPSW